MSELVLAGVVLSGAWTQLDEIGWLGLLPVALIALLDRFPTRVHLPRPISAPIERPAANVAAALCALLLAHLALTYREEFGFGGDEGYHLSAARMFAIYFMRAGPLLAIVAAGYTFLRVKGFRYAATIAMAGLTAASYLLPQSPMFGRYPAGFYLIATPLNVLFDLVRSPYPYAANHIINTLSLPIWLFALRPLVIGRWPDWRVTPVALLMYFQPLASVYLASPMLEPCCVSARRSVGGRRALRHRGMPQGDGRSAATGDVVDGVCRLERPSSASIACGCHRARIDRTFSVLFSRSSRPAHRARVRCRRCGRDLDSGAIA
jgi:hypothetical protein